MAKLPDNPRIKKVALATSPGDIIAIYDDYPGEAYPFEVFTVEKLIDEGFLYGLIYPPTRKNWKETVAKRWNQIHWGALDEDDNEVYTSAIAKHREEIIKAIFKYLG